MTDPKVCYSVLFRDCPDGGWQLAGITNADGQAQGCFDMYQATNILQLLGLQFLRDNRALYGIRIAKTDTANCRLCADGVGFNAISMEEYRRKHGLYEGD